MSFHFKLRGLTCEQFGVPGRLRTSGSQAFSCSVGKGAGMVGGRSSFWTCSGWPAAGGAGSDGERV